MTPRPCLDRGPGCLRFGNGTRCDVCEAARQAKRDKARPTTAQRGYGTTHKRTRARLLARHRDGDPCWRCGQPMLKTQKLHAGHRQDLADNPNAIADVLEHAQCNERAGGRTGARRAAARR